MVAPRAKCLNANTLLRLAEAAEKFGFGIGTTVSDHHIVRSEQAPGNAHVVGTRSQPVC